MRKQLRSLMPNRSLWTAMVILTVAAQACLRN
jgi:hypothetical protein